MIRASRSAGSSIRPGPVSPQACPPSSGPHICNPRDCSRAIFDWVAAFSHMAWFIAGATARAAVVARQSVANRSSASPWAIRARKSALAGATRTRSAQRASSICPIAASCSGSNSRTLTGWPDKACKVIGVMNSVAAGVITTRTSACSLRNRRTSSAAL